MTGLRTRSAHASGAAAGAGARSAACTDAAAQARAVSTWVAQWPRLERDLVRYVTYLLAGDTQAAEDVVQETAIRLWQHPEVLAGGEPLAGWLRTVARNIVIDHVRRRRARPTEVALAPAVDRAGPDPVEHLDQAASLASILSVLAPWHRDVVYEVYVRDRSVADVAATLGIPTGTVKSRCHIAIRQLRASWGDARATCV